MRGKKTNKLWLLYAYHRESGEIVVWVGKAGLENGVEVEKTAETALNYLRYDSGR
jgi:IS1 family transposase